MDQWIEYQSTYTPYNIDSNRIHNIIVRRRAVRVRITRATWTPHARAIGPPRPPGEDALGDGHAGAWSYRIGNTYRIGFSTLIPIPRGRRMRRCRGRAARPLLPCHGNCAVLCLA